MKKPLIAIVACCAIIVSACKIEPPSNYVEGAITSISSNLTNIEGSTEWNGLVSHSNETVKFGNGLVFRVKTDNGQYTIQVDPTDEGGTDGPQTIVSLAGALKVGDRVRFPTELHGQTNLNNQRIGFSKSKIGMLDPDDIELLVPSEQALPAAKTQQQ